MTVECLKEFNPFQDQVRFLQSEFLVSDLSRRDLGERYSAGEKAKLSAFVQKAWELRKPMLSDAIDITGSLGIGDLVSVGNYGDGEPFGRIPQEKDKYPPNCFFWANIPTSDFLIVARTRADELKKEGVERLSLVCSYLPFQRAERPVRRDDQTRELAIGRKAIKDLSGEFDTIFTLEAHSPGTAFFCIENGTSILDLSAIPLLIAKAKYEKCIDEEAKIVVAVGDDGAYELGKMTQYLLSRLFGDKAVPLVKGKKVKTENRTIVNFDGKELEEANGATVIIPEDIISSGRTMLDTVKKLKTAGAEKIIITATHAIFAPGIEELIKEEGVYIIVSNSRMDKDTLPQHTPGLTEEEREKVFFVDILKPLENVVDLDKQGKLNHVFRYDWEALLAETGLCLSPWQIAHFRQR